MVILRVMLISILAADAHIVAQHHQHHQHQQISVCQHVVISLRDTSITVFILRDAVPRFIDPVYVSMFPCARETGLSDT
jgi:uncharacterized membrane protein affecting hemolysin expression